MRYRKIPVVIDAWPWPEIAAEAREVVRDFKTSHEIKTLEGNMLRSEGDWLIRGIKGEWYPCKPDIFEKTYEAMETNPYEHGVEPRRAR